MSCSGSVAISSRVGGRQIVHGKHIEFTMVFELVPKGGALVGVSKGCTGRPRSREGVDRTGPGNR